MTYDPEKLTMLLVKHHWKKQLFTWAAQSNDALLDQNAREQGGQFDWWNRGPDSLLVYTQDGSCTVFAPRSRGLARYIVGKAAK
jgi:hypothetical protein